MCHICWISFEGQHIYLEDVETDVENDVDTEVLTLSPSLKF